MPKFRQSCTSEQGEKSRTRRGTASFRSLRNGGSFCQVCEVLAERVGFEPTLPFRVNTLSKRAPSATRPSLPRGMCYSKPEADRGFARIAQRTLFSAHSDFMGLSKEPQLAPPSEVGTPEAAMPGVGTAKGRTPRAPTAEAGTPHREPSSILLAFSLIDSVMTISPDAGTPDAGTLDPGTPNPSSSPRAGVVRGSFRCPSR
jgi:hypothetical protein